MQAVRSWVVSGSHVGEIDAYYWQGGQFHPAVVGQTPPPPSSSQDAGLGWVLLAAGGVLLLAMAAEAVPGALIAHYGFNVPWGKSILIGVGSAIGLGMLVSALNPPPATTPVAAGA